MESRKVARAGVFLAAICSCNNIICARVDRSEDDKVEAMLPRNDLNWQAMAWEILLLTPPSVDGTPATTRLRGVEGEETNRAEMNVLCECLIIMSY